MSLPFENTFSVTISNQGSLTGNYKRRALPHRFPSQKVPAKADARATILALLVMPIRSRVLAVFRSRAVNQFISVISIALVTSRRRFEGIDGLLRGPELFGPVLTEEVWPVRGWVGEGASPNRREQTRGEEDNGLVVEGERALKCNYK